MPREKYEKEVVNWGKLLKKWDGNSRKRRKTVIEFVTREKPCSCPEK